MDLAAKRKALLNSENTAQLCEDLRISMLARALRLKNSPLTDGELCAYFTDDTEAIRQRNRVIRYLRESGEAAAIFAAAQTSFERIAKLKEALINPTPKKYREPLLRYQLWREYAAVLDALISLPPAPDCPQIEGLRAELERERHTKKYAAALSGLAGFDFSFTNPTRLDMGVNCMADGHPVQLVFLDYGQGSLKTDALLERCEEPESAALCRPRSAGEVAHTDLENAVVTDLMRMHKEEFKALQKAELDFDEETDRLLELSPDLRFYLTALSFCGLNPDYPLCFGEEGESFAAEGIYSPLLAAGGVHAVDNDIELDRDFYIMTGANNAGKTEFLVTVGQTQFLYQIGFPLPCKKLKTRVFRRICTLFISGEQGGYEDSRMGAELERFAAITKLVGDGEGGLVLLNEPMTSTGAHEGAQICRDMAHTLMKKNCRGILVTHYYELYEKLGEEGAGCLRIAVSERDGVMTSTYKVEKKPPLYKSYAIELARRLGLTDGEAQ